MKLVRRYKWWIIAVAVLVAVAAAVAVVALQEPEKAAVTPTLTTTEPVFNVKDYGAKGDGQANDEYAILKAIDTAKGHTVYFPAGNYLVNEGFEIPRAVVTKGSADPDNASYLMVVNPQANDTVTWTFTWILP